MHHDQHRSGFDPASLAAHGVAFISGAGRGRLDVLAQVPGVPGEGRRALLRAVGSGGERPAGPGGDATPPAAHDASDDRGGGAGRRWWWRVVVNGPDGWESTTAPVEYSGDPKEVPGVWASTADYVVALDVCSTGPGAKPWRPVEVVHIEQALAAGLNRP